MKGHLYNKMGSNLVEFSILIKLKKTLSVLQIDHKSLVSPLVVFLVTGMDLTCDVGI